MIFKKKIFHNYKTSLLFFLIYLTANIVQAEKYHDLQKSYYGSLLAGQVAKYNNDNVIASEFYLFASKNNPKNSKLQNLSLMSLILAGKVTEAIYKIDIKNNKNLNNNSEIENLLLFVSLIKKQQYSQAQELLLKNKNLLISDKISPIINAWLANSFDSAIEYMDKFPYKSEGLVMHNIYSNHLASINIFYGNDNNAKKIFEKALSQNQEDKARTVHFYYNFIGKQFNVEKNNFLKIFSEQYPDHSLNIYIKKKLYSEFSLSRPSDGVSESFFNIAEILYSQGLYDTSIAFSNLSIYLNKKNYINYYLLAQNYQMLGKNNKAIEALSKIPLDNYLGWNTYLKLVDLNMQSNNFNKSKYYLNELITFQTDRKDFYYKSGEFYHNQKLYEKSISAFSKAIGLIKETKKDHWYLYYSRGMSYERSNKWKKAEKDFLNALKLFPDQPLVLNYLAYSWIDFGIKLDKAENLIKKAIKLRPNDGYFVDSLGWAYYRQGMYLKAVEELEKAVSLVPNDPIINDHLGDALWRAGYINEAKYQWQRALLYKPETELKEIIKFKLKKGL